MARSSDLSLADELELALMDTVGGEPFGPGLAARLERTVHAVLGRRGIRGAFVWAESGATGTRVHVELPPAPRRVAKIVVDLS